MRRTALSDQRSKQRELRSISVILRCQGGRLVTCKTLNLSVEGMLLESDEQMPAMGAGVEVCVRSEGWKREVPATVVHSNGSCMGIMFCKSQPELYRVITLPLGSTQMPVNSRTPLAAHQGHCPAVK